MSNQLGTFPYFEVYRLEFESGRSYVGFHKIKKENDSYITSSSYYKRHPEDRLVSRKILITVKNEYQATFLETWCILSDKAYHKETNVNYNLGSFFHRFSTAYHTPEEIRKSIEKGLKTKSKRTREQMRRTREKYRKTMSEKSPEELADIHYRQGRNKKGNTHKSEWWKSLSEEEQKATKEKMSEGSRKWRNSQSEQELKEFGRKISKIRKKYFESMSEQDKIELSERLKKSGLKRWANASEEEKRRCCRAFYKNAENLKKKVQCIETGEIFDSLQDVKRWLGPKIKGCNISAQIRGKSNYSFAYRHPITNEKLHWRFV